MNSLTPIVKGPTGPTERAPMSQAGGSDIEDPVARPDFRALDLIQGRMVKRGPFTEPLLALEILAGQFRGVVFSYRSFQMMPTPLANGMFPTQYEVEVHIIPDELKATFSQDDPAFDEITKTVVIAWLSYLNTHDLAPLIKMKVDGPTH